MESQRKHHGGVVGNFFHDVVGDVALGSLSALFKRRTKAMEVKSTLLGSLHDARAGVKHPGVQTIEEFYSRT